MSLAALAPAAAETSAADDATFALSRSIDPDGLTLLQKTRRATPTGLLYPYPYAPPEKLGLGGDWKASGFAELGGVVSWGGDDEAYFEEYTDHSDGFVDALRIEAQHTPSGAYAELGAQAIGRDDASLFVDTGVRGRLRVRGFYDELPHRYASDARVLFSGAGSEHLTLPTGLVPGGNADADIDAALASTRASRLVLTREKSGLDLRFDPVPAFGLRAGYRVEERHGERPFGGAIVFAFLSPDFGSVVETLEPLRSRTHDFHGGLSVSDPSLQLDLGYEGSIFDDRVQSLTWDNPFPGTGVDQGRFALAPDNAQHRVHGTLSWPLPGGRWTHTASWTTARQDERLLAPTLNPAVPDWTSPANSLSRQTANARVDATLVTSTFQVSPLRRLGLGGKLRFQRRNNQTNYTARNPATGEYGYVIEDGSFGVRSRYGAAPFDEERLDLEGSASWRLFSRTRLALEVERERVRRDQRARAVTTDDRGRVSLSTRSLPLTTVRLAYQISERRGSSFRRERDALFYSAGPPDFLQPAPGTPQRSLETFEQLDLADRLQHEATARVNFAIAEIADLAFAGGIQDDDYESRYGLRRARAWDANVELNIQPSPAFDVYAFGSAEWRRRALDTINSASSTGSELEPGGPVFPFDNAWATRSRTRSFAAGAGLSTRPFSRLELRGDYYLLVSRERISYAFASEGALAPGVSAQDAGTRFPDLRNTDHVLDASARIELTGWLAARLLYRFQRSQIANFHQTGLVSRIGHALYLGHVDGDFTAHVLGGSVQASF